MGGHHSHVHAASSGAEPFVAGRRGVIVLFTVLIPILMATAVALVVLWPNGTPPASRPTDTTAVAGERVSGVVRSSAAKTCEGESSDRLPDGTIPTTATCATVVARLSSGPDEGT